jgi:transposase|tara:strand:+ start:998 stop:2422 length:1425 start_codon:yes stop_codon:yes gene_type:complete
VSKAEAEALYNSGKKPTVKKLLGYFKEIKRLREKIANLEKNSQNSSKPPSSDSPEDKQKRTENSEKKKSGRKPGGQPGHQGNKRDLIPVEEVDEVIPCYPEECRSCKHFRRCKKNQRVGEPLRWQQTEIPPIEPRVTEYQVFDLSGVCGKIHKGRLPSDIARSNFGPRLTAICAYFTAVLRVPRRALQECLLTLFRVRLSLGSTQNLLEDTSKALEDTCRELVQELPLQPVVNADETGWHKRWLWIFVVTGFIYFHVAKSRASTVLRDIFGERYTGILCVDRWGAYTKYHKGLFQICWGHLKRDFAGVEKVGENIESDEAIGFAQRMEDLRKKLMSIWYRFKDGELTRKQLIDKSRHTRALIWKCLEQHKDSSQRCVKVLAGRLWKRKQHLFTFISHEGVEPTNNISERGLRSAVQWRKICFGNRSDRGAVLTSRLLTATRTCWLKKRDALEFLVSAITAHRKGQPAPSLLKSP